MRWTASAFLRSARGHHDSASNVRRPSAEAGEPGPDGPTAPRDGGGATTALVYVPGLDHHWFNRDAKLVAQQVAVALDRFHDAAEKFDVSPLAPTVHYGAGEAFSAPVHTIRRATPAGPQPVVDIYILDYHPTLTSPWERTNVAVQAAVVLLRVITGFGRLGRALLVKLPKRRRAKTVGEILQIGYLMGILLLLSLYLALLVVALGASFGEVIQDSEADRAQEAAQAEPEEETSPSVEWPPTPEGWDFSRVESTWDAVGEYVRPVWVAAEWVVQLLGALAVYVGEVLSRWWERGRDVWTMLALLGAAILVFLRNSQEMIKNAATTFVCAYSYLVDGAQRDAISGQLASLLQHLAERSRPYGDVQVLAYSFGSVAALDAFFPHDDRPSSGFEQVDSLVTVGCPFDMVRTYFPGYFEDRTRLADGIPGSWSNVYSPHDVLGSNFRDNVKRGKAEVGPCELRSDASGKNPKQTTIAKPAVNAVFHGGVSPRGRGPLGWLTLYGLRAHGLYWAQDANSYDALMLALPQRLRSREALEPA